jgi:hypothetical protein
MKKKLFTIAIALCMVFTMIPGGVFQAETAWAAGPSNLTVDNTTYYANGALKSIEASFGWSGATDVKVQLVLMEKKLNGGTDYITVDDFTNLGTYGKLRFTGYDDIKKYDKATGAFGLIKSSTLQPYQRGRLTEVLNLDDTDIPLNENKYYYVYIWTLWGSLYYPDHLVCAISVQDGIVKYAPADGKGYNTYDENKLDAVTSETAYDVTVNPGKGMTRDENSGSELQPNLNKGMTPVVYTADEGYYFPKDYAVTTVNGIMVRRDNATQITVYGTPSANATINLNAATEGNPPAENTAVKPTAKTGLKYDGKEQTGVEAGIGYTLEGNKATNAGNYTATATLDEGYKWSAWSTDPATIEWSIAKADKVKVTVDDMNAYVGDEVPTPTRSVSGLLENEIIDGTAVYKYQLKNADGTYGEEVNKPDMSKAGTYKVTVSGLEVSDNYEGVDFIEGTLTISEKPVSGGGHSYTQRPTIIADEGADTLLTFNGRTLTIAAKDGYEITDVLLNGVSKGAVAELTGLRTGDKVEVKTAKKAEPTDPEADKNAKLIKGIENTTIVLKSKLTKNGNVLLTWTKSKGYKVDYFEFYRSVKRYSGYGTKAFFTTADGSWSKYLNTKELKAGKTYYYKVRGVRVIDGQKYYTQWSNKAWRTIK